MTKEIPISFLAVDKTTTNQDDKRLDQESLSCFDGYLESGHSAEIVPIEQARKDVEKALDRLWQKNHFDEKKKQTITKIVWTFFNKLDPQKIIKGQLRGMIYGFLPALAEERDCVKGLFQSAIFVKGFDADKDEISVNDFIFQCLTRKCKPSNLSGLVYRLRKMPAIDEKRIANNRNDGIALGAVGFSVLREMIHDQRSTAFPLVKAMIQFSETGNNEDMKLIIDDWHKQYPDDNFYAFLQRENYFLMADVNTSAATEKEKVIDILHRLKENLSFVGSAPPQTIDEELNQALLRVKDDPKRVGSRGLDEYTPVLKRLNYLLLENVKKEAIGIEPSYIAAIGWLRHRLGKVLSLLPFEAVEELPFSDSLTEVLQLMELTANNKPYSAQGFSRFVGNYKQTFTLADTYKIISSHCLERQTSTIKYFINNALDSYCFGGNLTKEEVLGEHSLLQERVETQLQALGSLADHQPTTLKGRQRWYEQMMGIKY